MPEDAQAEVEETQPRGRRQRRKRRNKATFWNNPNLPHRTVLLVAGLALMALAASAYQLRQASLLFGQLQIGAPEAEVAYLYGQPQRKEAAGTRWIYSVGADAELAITLDRAGAVESMKCVARNETAFGCPEPVGMGLGTPENTLLNRLGPASSQKYIPNGKIMTFDEIGMIYTLHQFRVTGYTKVKRSSRLGFVSRVFWNLLP